MKSFDEIYGRMKNLGMKVPESRVFIKIPGAARILEDCFRYFLSFENAVYLPQPEYTEVAEWLEDNRGRGLFMYGDCGRGKTFLANYVIPAILLKYAGKVVFSYDIQEMNRRLDEVLNRPIIVLDDIGTEEISVSFGNKRAAFIEIMDAAEKYGKLMIVTTNLDGDRIADRYGPRALERIISTTKRVEFKGKSLRK